MVIRNESGIVFTGRGEKPTALISGGLVVMVKWGLAKVKGGVAEGNKEEKSNTAVTLAESPCRTGCTLGQEAEGQVLAQSV